MLLAASASTSCLLGGDRLRLVSSVGFAAAWGLRASVTATNLGCRPADKGRGRPISYLFLRSCDKPRPAPAAPAAAVPATLSSGDGALGERGDAARLSAAAAAGRAHANANLLLLPVSGRLLSGETDRRLPLGDRGPLSVSGIPSGPVRRRL
jgi:hypothetical protein